MNTTISLEQTVHELVAVAHSKPKCIRGHHTRIRPHYFSAALPNAKRWQDALAYDDWGLLNPLAMNESDRSDLLSFITVGQSWIFDFTDNDLGEGAFGMQRTRPRSAVSVASKVFPIAFGAKRLFEYTCGGFTTSGRWLCGQAFVADMGTNLLEVTNTLDRPREADPEICRAVYWAGSIQLSLRYEWQLVFGHDECASVAIPIERDACPDLVRLRDVPEGRARRAALANFICAHWRRKRARAGSESDRTFVKRHLRGERFFRWQGLTCEVRPPVYELERLSAERAEMGR